MLLDPLSINFKISIPNDLKIFYTISHVDSQIVDNYMYENKFISGWSLSPDQITNMENNGNIQ